jgi:hypothetical protein
MERVRLAADPTRKALRPMLIRIDDPSLVDELCANFQRAGFTAVPAGECLAKVRRLDSPSPDQERREVELHLRVWRAIHPEVEAAIVD